MPWTLQLVIFLLACSAIGYLTNLVAVRMIFWPHQPRRLLGLVFQGVLPKHQANFSRQLATVLTSDFITTSEMVERLDVPRLYQAVQPLLERAFEEVLGDLRARLPLPQRALLGSGMVEAVRAQIERELAAALPGLVAEVRGRADELVNLEDLITEKLIAIGPARLEELIYRVARRELVSIVRYGALLGLIIGLLQFAFVRAIAIPFSEPVVGALVGTVTNYLAVKMLYYPRLPRRILFFTLQGLFPKRQEEIARELAHIAAADFIIAREIFDLLARSLLPARVDQARLAALEAMLGTRFPALKAMLESMLPPAELDGFRQQLVVCYGDLRPRLGEALVQSAAGQLDVRAILESKVVGLSKLGFEQLIRQLFSKEEFYLVIYGTLLGALMGGIQLLLTILG